MKYRSVWFATAITALIPAGALPAAAETIAVFTKSAGNPISRAVRAGAEAVAKANGVTGSTTSRPRPTTSRSRPPWSTRP